MPWKWRTTGPGSTLSIWRFDSSACYAPTQVQQENKQPRLDFEPDIVKLVDHLRTEVASGN